MDIGRYEDALAASEAGEWVEVQFAGGTGRIKLHCARLVDSYRTRLAVRHSERQEVDEKDDGYADYLDWLSRVSWEEMYGTVATAWEGFTDHGELMEFTQESWNRAYRVPPIVNAVFAKVGQLEKFGAVDDAAVKNSNGASTGRAGGRGSRKGKGQRRGTSSSPAEKSAAPLAN